MQTTFQARHFKAPDSLKKYAIDEVNRLNKFYDGIVSCDITLIQEKSTQIAEMAMKVSNGLLKAKESSDDFYKSIDLAVEKLRRQLKKHKAKLRNYSHDKINDVLPSPPLAESGTNQ